MTRRWVVAVSFLSVVFAFSQALLRGDGAHAGPAPQPQARPVVAVGTSFVIEPPMADYVHELDPREEREQIRDWAVLGTLTRLGATVQQVAAATYQVPPARLPYLDELYSFEYGRGRRAYLSNRVLMFRDGDDPDPQATIGRLADRVRMENGEVPKVVELYVVDDQRDQGAIRVTRAADLTREQLFSEAYGYVEGKATTAQELSTWLERVDDLTFAKLGQDGALQLGGRRFAQTPTANLTIDDVTAIYHAQKQLDQRRIDALAELIALPPIINRDLGRFFGLAYIGAERDKLLAAIRSFEGTLTFLPERARAMRALATAFSDSGAPGFSLDPEWLPDPEQPRHPLMLARIRAFAEDPCADLKRTVKRAVALLRQEPDESRRTSRTTVGRNVLALVLSGEAFSPGMCAKLRAQFSPVLQELVSQLEELEPDAWNTGFAPYHQLVAAWKQRSDAERDAFAGALVARTLEFHQEDTSVQCARYEGLAGTRVGITLFYTDLLAKIWESTDFGHTAPIAAVPGFVSEPHLNVSAAFRKETIDLPSTRLWFGARPNGVSRLGNEHEPAFVFDHQFTRVYAAGSNPGVPEIETQPNEASRRSLSWWDRHFDDVADYEQEYHRQNQIMKWSLVTAILPGTLLGNELRERTPFHEYKFADWLHSHRRVLRFTDQLPRVEQGIAGRECIPLLSSYAFDSFGGGRSYITGGVSMAGRAAPQGVAAVNAARPLGARVSSTAADLGAGTAGTATRARAMLNGETVTFSDAALARTRTVTGEVKLGTPRVSYAPGASRGSVAIQAGERGAIGQVEAGRTVNGTAIRWSEGAVERARLGKPQLGPSTLEGADKAAQAGRAVDAAKVYEKGLPRELSATDKLAREAVGDIARRRPAALQVKLERLAADGKQLSPSARDALGGSLRGESEAVARRFDTAVKTGKPLNEPGVSVTVQRGHVGVTREVAQLPRASAPPPTTDLSKGVRYVDSRLRVGREGLLPDTGGQAARWSQQRGIKVTELKSSQIGELPDRFVEKATGLTLERVPGVVSGTELGLTPPVFVIQKCDADHKTATTNDDCNDQR